MQETKSIWVDGKLIPWNDAKIHVLTHTMHYGSGVFEGIRFYQTSNGPAIFRLQEHVDRLFFSAGVLKMKVPFTKEQISQAIVDVVKDSAEKSGYIRPLIFYGYGKMGLGTDGAPVNVIVACWPWGKYLSENPIKVKISSFVRIHPKSTVSEAKISGNYQNSILAHQEAQEYECDEALLLDHRGFVAEGPGENLFLVKSGKLITPKLGTVLPGITRKTIMELASDLMIPVVERDVTVDDVYAADELFFTGTAAEVTSIGEVDFKKVKHAPGPLTTKFKKLYGDVVCGKVNDYAAWLTVAR